MKELLSRRTKEDRRYSRIGLNATLRSILAGKWQLAKILTVTIIEAVMSALIPVSFKWMLSNQNTTFLSIYLIAFGSQWLLASLWWVLMKAQIAAMLRSINDQLDAAINKTSPVYLESVGQDEARLHSSQLRQLASITGSDILFAMNCLGIVCFNILGVWLTFGTKYLAVVGIGTATSILFQLPVIWMNRHFSKKEKENDAIFNNQFDSKAETLFVLQEAEKIHWKGFLARKALEENLELFRRSEWLRGTVTGFSHVVPIVGMMWISMTMAFADQTPTEMIVALQGYVFTIVPVMNTATRVLLRVSENDATFRHLGMVLSAPRRKEGNQEIVGGIRKLIISATLCFRFLKGGGLFLHRGISSKELVFEVGKFYALVGPSGAGKSQLMGVLSRRLDNTAGEIVWNGTYWLQMGNDEQSEVMDTTIASFGKHVHTCPQKPEWVDGLKEGPFTRGTIEENIRLKICSESLDDRCRQFIQEAAEAVELHDKLDQDVATASGGEQARVSIARGLVGCMLNPNSWLLLDEAVSALNKALVLQLMPRILRLQEKYGFGVIMVSHADYANPSHAQALVFRKNKAGVPQGIIERGPVWRLRLNPWSNYNRVNQRGVTARILNRLSR